MIILKLTFYQRNMIKFYIWIDKLSDSLATFLTQINIIDDVDHFFKIINKYFTIDKKICKILKLPINNEVLNEMIFQITWEFNSKESLIDLQKLFNDYCRNPEDFINLETYLGIINEK